jgi:hypothetical protein
MKLPTPVKSTLRLYAGTTWKQKSDIEWMQILDIGVADLTKPYKRHLSNYLSKLKMGECHSLLPDNIKSNVAKKISILKKKRTKYTKQRKVLKKVGNVAMILRERHLEKVDDTPPASQSSQKQVFEEIQKYHQNEDSGAIFLHSTTFREKSN